MKVQFNKLFAINKVEYETIKSKARYIKKCLNSLMIASSEFCVLLGVKKRYFPCSDIVGSNERRTFSNRYRNEVFIPGRNKWSFSG